MGWLTMPIDSMGHDSAKAYLDDQFTWRKTDQGTGITSSSEVIASSCIQNKRYYAAVLQTIDGVPQPIFAIVCLVMWNPRAADGYGFGYKDMSESCGPCEADCPERILDLLGPPRNDHAREWRERCRANLARRGRTVEDGMRIKLPQVVKFTDGHEGDEFIVEKRGRAITLRDPVSKSRYRLTNFRSCAWTVVPETKVLATIF